MKELVISILCAICITLLFLIIRRCLQILTVFLNKKKAEAAAGNQAMEQAYNLAIMVLDSIAEITISRIETTKAASIRKAVKAGEKEFSELTKLSDEAYQNIVDQLGPTVYQGLEGCVKDIEELIRNKIEEVLPRVKASYSSLDNGVEELHIGYGDARGDIHEGAEEN